MGSVQNGRRSFYNGHSSLLSHAKARDSERGPPTPSRRLSHGCDACSRGQQRLSPSGALWHLGPWAALPCPGLNLVCLFVSMPTLLLLFFLFKIISKTTFTLPRWGAGEPPYSNKDWGYGKYLEFHGLAASGEEIHYEPPCPSRLSSLTAINPVKPLLEAKRKKSHDQ